MAVIVDWKVRWDIISYVVDCYAGTEEKDGAKLNQFATRRMFLWQEGGEVRLGNIEAFTVHVQSKFDLYCVTARCLTTRINRVLLDMGERIYDSKTHAAPQVFGLTKRPEPEYTVVQRVVGHGPS
jgi:hypothetical protein